jgi:hypothetical protein
MANRGFSLWCGGSYPTPIREAVFTRVEDAPAYYR